ncbi:PKD domain-containing protein [Flammeovirga sp. MY04]|uniref:PKD domain-containing protein n=1 Tax=Flammeovirga sp. MY04 TaxID=1191459 RepID=UPI0009FC5297|nr:PKD domain-containing protein [Flammeovirga sp. MY04]ANQ52417.2 PKD domain-containing protein [Flammeovirga sp. MY04]
MKLNLLYITFLLILTTGLTNNTFSQRLMQGNPPSGTDISGGVVEACDFLLTSFYVDDQGLGPITNYSWNFGNGNTSTLANPTEAFTDNSGSIKDFTVTVSFTQGGTTKTLSTTVRLKPIPTIDFESDVETACDGARITFTKTTNIDLANYEFIIDGKSYQDGQQSHQLAPKADGYDVYLVGETLDGCKVETFKQTYINITERIYTTIDPTIVSSCQSTLTQTFTAETFLVKDDSPAPDITYTWNFGDGTTSTDQNPTHTFDISNGKNYTVSVTATNGGCVDTQIANVYLGVSENMFDYTPPATFCATYPVTFRPQLPADLDGEQITWNFGDGTIVTSNVPNNVVHDFSNTTGAPVNYTVTATLDNGCTWSEIVTVPSMVLSDISITADNTLFCSDNFSVNMSINNLHDVNNYFWRIRETNSTDFPNNPNPTFTFNAGGTYTIQLIANDNGECLIDEVEVTSTPIDTQIVGVGVGVNCAPYSTTLSYNLSQGGIAIPDNSVSRTWTVTGRTNGVNLTGTGTTFPVNNLTADDYDVTVVLDFGGGCTSTDTRVINVGEQIDLDFTFFPGPAICNNTTVDFTNTSDRKGIPDADIQYYWDFNVQGAPNWQAAGNVNGNSSHTFNELEAGFYTIGFYAVQNGCEAVPVFKQIEVITPRANFDMEMSLACDPTSITIDNLSTGAEAGGNYIWDISVSGTGGNRTTQIITTNINEDIPNHPDFLGLNIDFGDQVTALLTVQNSASVPSVTPPNFCVDDYEVIITIPNKPPPMNPRWGLANNNYTNPTEICSGTRLYFDPAVNNNTYPGSYFWRFTNLTTGTEYTRTNRRPNLEFNEGGDWEIEVTVNYNNSGCTETITTGPFTVYEMDFRIDDDVDNVCIGEPITYFVEPGYKLEAPNITWVWEVNGTDVSSGSGPVVDDLVWVYNDVLTPQSDRHRVRLKVYSDICDRNSNTERTRVTQPVLDFTGPIEDYVSFAFRCDYIETYIDPNINTNTVYNPWNSDFIWELEYPDGTKTPITPDGIDNYIFRFDNLTLGTYKAFLAVTDDNGCTTLDSLTFDVPEIPFSRAAFTPSEEELACPGFINFTDLADGTDGNTIPRQDANGNEVSISDWVWSVTLSDGTVYTKNDDQGEFSYYFEPGDYKISMAAQDTEGCILYADSMSINVGGVKGDIYIHKKIGYWPLNTNLEAIPADVSGEIQSIEYLWTLGNGGAASGQIPNVDYEPDWSVIPNSSISYFPFLFFNSSIILVNGDTVECRYQAYEDPLNYVTILKNPEVEIDDIFICTTEGDTTINAFDPNFQLTDIDTTHYSYKSEIFYQWYVDGQLIPAMDGGIDSTITLTYCKDTTNCGYFDINPDDVDGRDYTLEIWLDAEYIDKVDPTHNHTDQRVGYSTRTFNVKYDPTPVAVLPTLNPICLSDSIYIDASNSGFQPYTRGNITEYRWNITSANSYLKDTITTEPELGIIFPEEGDYDVQLTVVSDNICADSTVSQTLRVKPLPVVDFEAQEVCIGDEMLFNNLTTFEGTEISTDPSIIQEVKWYFDVDNSPNDVGSTDINPLYAYPAPGTYNVLLEVFTLEGCMESFSKEVIVRELPTITVSDSLYICFGDQVTLSVNGGTTYEWSTGETTQDITVAPIADSLFVVKAWNQYNCLTIDSVKVFVIPDFRERQTIFVACEGEEITFDARINDYDGTVESFEWVDNESTDPTLTVSTPGDYTVINTITRPDGGSCTFTKTFTARFNPLPNEFAVDTLVHCFSDGPITIDAPTGPSYAYVWDSGENTPSVIKNAPGTYTVTITDTSDTTNCSTITSVVVFDPLTDAAFNFTQVCLGTETELTAQYENLDGLKIEYQWTLGTYESITTDTPNLTYEFPDFGDHEVTLVVNPIGGCPSPAVTQTVTVYELPEPSFDVDEICIYGEAEFNNNTTYQGVRALEGGFDIALIEWDFNYDGSTPNFTSNEFSPRNAYNESGTFTILLQVTTTNGCTKQFMNTLVVHPEPVITLTEDTYICEDDQITLEASGGSTYYWEGLGLTDNKITVDPKEDQTYVVQVTSAAGCVSYDSVTVYVIPKIKLEDTYFEVCEGETVELNANIDDYDGVSQDFVWSNGETSDVIYVDQPGTYTVSNTVTHESGKECVLTQSFEVVHRPLPAEFAVKERVICFDTESQIILEAPQGNNFVYYWEDTGETSSTVSRTEEGEYTVYIIDESYDTDCETITSVVVDDICPPRLIVPTAFTPNYDGTNDEFLIRSKYATDIKLNIYNRWGEIIFSRTYADSKEARTEGNGWDGMYRGNLVMGGVYTVIVEYLSELDGENYRNSTPLTVIR